MAKGTVMGQGKTGKLLRTQLYAGELPKNTSRNISCTHLKNYKELTVENFGMNVTRSWNQQYSGASSNYFNYSMSYNAQTGILTLSSAREGSEQMGSVTATVYCWQVV